MSVSRLVLLSVSLAEEGAAVALPSASSGVALPVPSAKDAASRVSRSGAVVQMVEELVSHSY